MARNRRKSARKASASLLMLLVIASAILAFIPFRVTLAAGSLGNTALDQVAAPYLGTTLGTANLTGLLAELAGTHVAVDGLSMLVSKDADFLGLATTLKADLYGLRIQQIRIDISNSLQTDANFQLPFAATAPGTAATPVSYTGGNIIQVRATLMQVAVTGYVAPTSTTVDRYGETDLVGLNVGIMLTIDRIFIDLFVDPYAGITTYLVQADMTVYQGLALLLQTAAL